jgi:hypothetical protein
MEPQARPENRGDVISQEVSLSEERIGVKVLEMVREERPQPWGAKWLELEWPLRRAGSLRTGKWGRQGNRCARNSTWPAVFLEPYSIGQE